MPRYPLARHVHRPRLELLEDRCLLDASGPASLIGSPTFSSEPAFRDDRILVRFRDEPFALPGSSLGERIGGIYEIRLDVGASWSRLLALYQTHPGVAFAQPDYQITVAGRPNDPSFGAQWALQNTGQGGGRSGTDINALAAWNVTTGSGRIIVAVIDSGVDYTHRDLAANMWRNPGEIPGNGLDDDGNGYVDDVYGYDFANNDSDPMDDNGHGTHVAGILGATANNGRGVAGVIWNVQIMALKFLRSDGSGYTSDALRALNYAVAHGAVISNNSWGGGSYDLAMLNGIRDARDAGHIFVTAAGNRSRDLDFDPSYPASYDVDNIVTVAALDRNNRLASFSNYGRYTVDLAAPGVNILSTTPRNNYSYYSGTSMAVPHVAATLALVWDLHPAWSYRQVIAQVLNTVTPVNALRERTITGGRLDAGAAVTAASRFSDLPRIVEAEPLARQDGSVAAVRLRFSKPLEPSSFTVGDILTFSGPAGPIRPTQILPVNGTDDFCFDVIFPTQSVAGAYQLVIGPDICDQDGNRLDQNGDGVGGDSTADTFAMAFTVRPRYQYVSDDADKPVPDFATTVSYLDVDRDVILRDLDVQIHVSHSYVGDLRIRLVAPDGRRIPLVKRRGGSGDDFLDTLFDDQAAAFIGGSSAPFAGSFRPEKPLATFHGMNARGRWQLWIEDLAHGDSGWLHAWSLTVSPVGPASRHRTQRISLQGLQDSTPLPSGKKDGEVMLFFNGAKRDLARHLLGGACLQPPDPSAASPEKTGESSTGSDCGSHVQRGNHPGKDIQSDLHLLSGDAQRRTEANRTFTAAEKQQTVMKRRIHQAITELGGQLSVGQDVHGDHKP